MVTAPSQDESVREFFAQFRVESSAFEKLLPEFLSQFPGEYVALRRGELIGHDKDWNSLVSQARERFPNEFVFVEKVTDIPEPVVDMDSMED